MSDWRDEVEGLTLQGQIRMPYTWSVGEVGSRFLVALRDEHRILGSRCSACGTVYVPPRKNCGRCFADIKAEDWLEVGTEGAVTAYTVVHEAHPLQPARPPFAYAIVRLDGADVGLLHLVRDGLERLRVGARVRARYSEQRSGQILDIDCFELIES